jgi:di/tricarboxylate transporter
MGVSPYAFLMVVAAAASTAFATPVASPTNTLVLGPGDYRFNDFVKVGAPLIVLSMLVALFAVPLLFPLQSG